MDMLHQSYAGTFAYFSLWFLLYNCIIKRIMTLGNRQDRLLRFIPNHHQFNYLAHFMSPFIVLTIYGQLIPWTDPSPDPVLKCNPSLWGDD